MKKNVFELTYAEGKKIEKELKETSYGKQFYFLVNYPLYVVIVLIFLVFFLYFVDGKNIINEAFMIALIAACFLQVLLRWKWMQLIKVYYDEKVKK